MPANIKYGYELPPAKDWDTEWSDFDSDYDKIGILQEWYDEHVEEIERLAKDLYYLRKVREDESKQHKEREESSLDEILKLQDENTEIRKQGEKEFEYLRTKIEELEKENEKLKNPVIPDRDARCSQLDMRIGYSYVSSCIKEVLPSLYLGEGYGEPEIDVDNLPEVVYDEVAKTIDGSINAYMFEDPNELTIHENIYADVLEKLHELREQGVLEEEE
jgi:hypothetical protein